MTSSPRQPPLRVLSGGARANASPPPLDDAALLVGIVQGDQRVAMEFYQRMLPSVEAALLRVLGRRESEHEDLVQTSFEQIVKTLSKQQFAGACSLKTWASTIAGNVALKSLRSRIRRRRVLATLWEPALIDERPSTAPDAEQSMGTRRQLDEVRQKLAQLAPNKAEAVLLHDVLGHGLTDIAAMTGCTVSAAQTRLSRGRRELSRLMSASQKAGRL